MLTLAEIPAFWIDAVYGAIILIALVVSWATGGTAEETSRTLRALGARRATDQIFARACASSSRGLVDDKRNFTLRTED